jgi:hypothetical protein
MTNDQMTNDANDNQMTPHHLAFVISQNDRVSFDQMTPNPKNGQMTRSFPNTELYQF